MDREQLIAEIKKQILEELKDVTSPLTDKISAEQKQQMTAAKKTVESSVQKNPWIAVGLAVLAGFVLARAIYRREDEQP